MKVTSLAHRGDIDETKDRDERRMLVTSEFSQLSAEPSYTNLPVIRISSEPKWSKQKRKENGPERSHFHQQHMALESRSSLARGRLRPICFPGNQLVPSVTAQQSFFSSVGAEIEMLENI